MRNSGTSSSYPDSKSLSKYKEMNNIIEVSWSDWNNYDISIRMIDKNHYVNLKTGEIVEFEPIENRSENINSVKRSLSRLRDYINTNVSDAKNCRWLTLTYAENMTDTKRLYKDFEKFIKRFRYKFGKCEYIASCEPQERGAWHMHVILIFPTVAPYIDNSIIENLWKQGFTKTQAIKGDIDNIGAYLSAYLSDFEVPIESSGPDIVQKQVDGKNKKFKKGARLNLYPAKFNIYRISSGIKPPEVVQMTYEETQKKVTAATMTYEMELYLIDAVDCKPIRTIRKYYYNKNRLNTQCQDDQNDQQRDSSAFALACDESAGRSGRTASLDDILLDYSLLKKDLE